MFGKDFEEKTYNAIIRVCDLKIDLDSFPKGDLTEVGQRGVILSGGQRVRISLARMIYSDADIYLLDDPLSAVDAKVGKHLFDRCIKEFLAGRIRILVTHHLQFLKQTDYVVVLENGIVAQECKCIEMQIQKKGVFSGTTQERGTCTEWDSLEKSLGTFEGSSDKPVAVERKDKRIDLNDAEEDRVVGSVKWWRYWRYFRAALPVEMLVGLFAFFCDSPSIVDSTLLVAFKDDRAAVRTTKEPRNSSGLRSNCNDLFLSLACVIVLLLSHDS